jgi:hypothetical protein
MFRVKKEMKNEKNNCCWRRYLAKRVLSELKVDFEQQKLMMITSLSQISALVRCR